MSDLRCSACGALTFPNVERCVCGHDPRPSAAPAAPAPVPARKTTACSACGGVVAWEAPSCPHCGKTWPAGIPKKPTAHAGGALVAKGCLGLILAVVGLVVLAAIVSSFRSAEDSVSFSAPRVRDVTYRVTGGAEWVSLTYQNEEGGTEQISNARIPWSKSFSVAKGGFVYIAAQNKTSSGTVRCEIDVDGQTLKASTSEGAYTIATCSGLVGREQP